MKKIIPSNDTERELLDMIEKIKQHFGVSHDTAERLVAGLWLLYKASDEGGGDTENLDVLDHLEKNFPPGVTLCKVIEVLFEYRSGVPFGSISRLV